VRSLHAVFSCISLRSWKGGADPLHQTKTIKGLRSKGSMGKSTTVCLRLGKARRNYMMMHFLSFSLGEMVPEAALDVGAALRPVLGCRRSCCRLRCRAARESSSFCNCRAIC
jgi:hypothetical protein